jgi:proline dehydrogenase
MNYCKRELRDYAKTYYARKPFRYHLIKAITYACADTGRYIPSKLGTRILSSIIGSPMSSLLFSNFCGGETVSDALKISGKYANEGIGTILDRIGEPSNESDAVRMKVTECLPEARNSSGDLFFSVKFSALFGTGALLSMSKRASEHFDSKSVLSGFDDDTLRLYKNILSRLKEIKASGKYRVLIDAEWSDIQPAITNLAYTLMLELNQDSQFISNTYQAYIRNSRHLFETHLSMAKSDGIFFGCKLVRGAYLTYETSRNNGAVFTSIEDTHDNYNYLLELAALSGLSPKSVLIASHNEESIAKALKFIQAGDTNAILFAQLHGMRDYITYYLSDKKMPVLKYVPYGKRDEAIPYLIRSAEENSGIFESLTFEKTTIYKELLRKIFTFNFS